MIWSREAEVTESRDSLRNRRLRRELNFELRISNCGIRNQTRSLTVGLLHRLSCRLLSADCSDALPYGRATAPSLIPLTHQGTVGRGGGSVHFASVFVSESGGSVIRRLLSRHSNRR